MNEGALLDRGRSPASESLFQREGSSLEHQARRVAVLARQRLEQPAQAMSVPFKTPRLPTHLHTRPLDRSARCMRVAFWNSRPGDG